MSEYHRPFVTHNGRRWQLSARDVVLINRLHTVLWQWLYAADTAKDVIAAGHILQALEDLIEDGTPPGSGEYEINLRARGQDGFGAHMSLSPEALMFSLTRYVWTGDQGHDYGSIPDPEGRAFHLEFTPEGSFDGKMFDVWMRYAEEAAPLNIGGPASAYASWYS